ncbi:MAG TPA: polymer-forming cytoskeletal protein [Xanthobacteraceae bacterium]|jgi:cytoskeletal protein CcmA (bactofilin family)
MEALEQLAAGPEPVTRPEAVCSIGSDMSIVGKILCDAPVAVFGHIAGELRGSHLMIGAGARVEGSVSAQEVTVLGRIKGTIRAVQVKLLGRAIVEGYIFHEQLSMEEETSFDGSSRPLLRG